MAAVARTQGRAAARFAQRRLFSSGGKVLGEEEKAAENVYIKKMEHEKLEKLARQGPSPGEQASAPVGTAANAVKTGSSPTGSTSAGVSTDKHRNYAVLAGTVAALSGLGWYLLSKPKKSEEIVD
uniref:F1F0-ATPase inhibitor protein n=1 Tax=Leersia perrieri TaxID=77586 RepID=A0A0D9XGZ9_9ORYZ